MGVDFPSLRTFLTQSDLVVAMDCMHGPAITRVLTDHVCNPLGLETDASLLNAAEYSQQPSYIR